MIEEFDNPFSVTKATEFDDLEINEYWVNFNTRDEQSIKGILNPGEFLPKYVIGGKGCGKTHILRYFSYPLQKIRIPDIHQLLEEDKYIGMYSVFHGINSSRFAGKGITEDAWQSIFEYYFELYICDSLLNCLKEIFQSLKLSHEKEVKFIKAAIAIFSDQKDILHCESIENLIEYFNKLRRKIDGQILNAAYTRKLEYDDVAVLFSPGDLIFGIPKIVPDISESFKDVKFIYILDEYEKFFEWQKMFVNTLVWDKKNPVTFWIGARRHGFTTRETKSGQEMKFGSEFADVDLDFIIRANEDIYKEFAEKLFTSRLVKYYEKRKLHLSPDEVNKNFHSKFESYDENFVLEQVVVKNAKKEYEHLQEFRKKLELAIKEHSALGLKKEDDIQEVVDGITENTGNNPLFQKYKLFYFYQLWFKAKPGDTIKKFLTEINREFVRFLSHKESKFDDIKDKRKKDFIAQLAKENNLKNIEHTGISRFIELSQGNARHLILILKRAVELARIRGERPLEDGGRISLDSQYLAVYDTAKWFYEDIEVVGEVGKRFYSSLKNLTDYLTQERFCDKPVETTISCFYVKADELSISALKMIELMKMHAVLLESFDGGRFDKNTGRKERLLQINKILAPLWSLPTVIRGSLSLNNEIAETIFNYDLKDKFDRLYKTRKGQLNAPSFLKKGLKSNQNEIF